MITIPIEIGDTILTGRFKNRKTVVKDIEYDSYNMPIINGKSIMKIRIQKLMPTKEQTMIKEAPATNNPKVQKIVDEINKLIASAVDGDGDPIEVVDSSSTWEEPMVYEPVVYSNGRLKFTYREPMSGNKKKVDVVNSRDIQTEGISMLRDLSKWYKKAIKQAGKPTRESRVVESSNANITTAFLDSLDPKIKNDILTNIAKHYGISNQEAYEEVTDEEAESIMDYVTGSMRSTVSLFFNKFKQTMRESVRESKVKSKMKLSEVISKGVFIKIKKEDDKFWFYVDNNGEDECISNVGFPTKEAAEHAALTKGFNVDKGGVAKDELPDTVEVPKPSKREKTPDTEKPKEIDLGKEKEVKLTEQLKSIIRKEIKKVSQKKKTSINEAVKITKKIEDALKELKDLQETLAQANAEIEKIKKKFDLSNVQKKADAILKDQLWDFLEELKKDETKIVKLKGIILKINRYQASPATYEYEKVLDFVMTQVNQDVKAKILAELKAVEKIGKTKANVSFTTEGIGDVWNSLVNFLGKFIPSLKKKGQKIDSDIAKAEAQLASIE